MKRKEIYGSIVWCVMLLILLAPRLGMAQKREPLPTKRPNLEIGRAAHRGAWHYAPENTVPAYVKAVELGFQYIEIDVRYSKDGVPVLHHDPMTMRDNLVWIPIKSLTVAQLKKLNEGFWYGPKFWDTKVATLEEALVAVQGKINLYLDLKEPPTPELDRLLRKYGFAPDHILVLGKRERDQVHAIRADREIPGSPRAARKTGRPARRIPDHLRAQHRVRVAHARPRLRRARQRHPHLLQCHKPHALADPLVHAPPDPELGADVAQIDNLKVFNQVMEEIKKKQH